MAESTKKAPRERRRSLVAEPFEELDAEAHERGAPGQGETLKKAALAAAVTAGAGALAGAAKALLDKRKAHESPPSSDAAENESDESDDAQADEPEARAPEPAVVDELDDEDAEEGDDESGDELDELDEPDEAEEADDGDLDDAAEARSDASEVVSRAREQFEHLLGREPESISRIERTNSHWSVTLEAVELRRIPDSTDVLASYELVLDDDGNVARMARKGRYVRSQGDAA
jgi:hypothetical protein